MTGGRQGVLVSWMGANDLKALTGEHSGPLAAMLSAVSFDEVHLLYNYPKKEVAPYIAWLKGRTSATIEARKVKLKSPVDYHDIYLAADGLLNELAAIHAEPLAILLSPGIRRKRQQAIQLADEFLRAVFLDMFGDPVTNPKGWNTKCLDSLVKNPITYGILKPEEYVEGGVPMLRIQDLKGGLIDEGASFHLVSGRLASEYRRTTLEGNEIVISLVGTVGLVAKVPVNLAGANVHRNLGVISLCDDQQIDYICSLMQLPHFMTVVDKVSKGGVHRLLNLADLKEIKIPIPDITLVNKFTNVKRKVQSLRGALNNFSTEFIFESLSQKAFSGEL